MESPHLLHFSGSDVPLLPSIASYGDLTLSNVFQPIFNLSHSCPIGYEAFVRHLVEKGHPKEAVSYVQRCDAPKRVDLYVDCGEWVMAGKECKERGDRAKLECVSLGQPLSL